MPSEFKFGTADALEITDHEISGLLTTVYVDGGFTSRDDAVALFDPSAVRMRGALIAARHIPDSKLAGFIVVVPHGSATCRYAGIHEGELHLLGVAPEFRRQGIGRRLIEAGIGKARQQNWSRLILWTQPSMTAAQKIYEAAGFRQAGDIEINGRKYKMFALRLDTHP